MIFVTGPLGGSLMGRHLRPEPRVAEALALHDIVSLHAMIDISDGLASDLGHILEESGGLDAILDPDAIPIHPDAVARSEDGRTPLDHALNDGEDFELCLVVPAEEADAPGSPAGGPNESAWWTGPASARGRGRLGPLKSAGSTTSCSGTTGTS